MIGYEALSSSATPEHYTPAHWVALVHEVMGGIDCDPASCAKANETVRARVYYDEAVDGLSQKWAGRVFVNPPGDRSGKLVQRFWSKLANEIRAGRVNEFVWLAFNLSQLRTLQRTSDAGAFLLGGCDIFVPDTRIRFTGGSPTKDNAFLHWGYHDKQRTRFREVFGAAGGQLWFGRGHA